jgi:hypothetical protein
MYHHSSISRKQQCGGRNSKHGGGRLRVASLYCEVREVVVGVWVPGGENRKRKGGKKSSAGGVLCIDESNGEKLWSKLDLYFHGCKLIGPYEFRK